MGLDLEQGRDSWLEVELGLQGLQQQTALGLLSKPLENTLLGSSLITKNDCICPKILLV